MFIYGSDENFVFIAKTVGDKISVLLLFLKLFKIIYLKKNDKILPRNFVVEKSRKNKIKIFKSFVWN